MADNKTQVDKSDLQLFNEKVISKLNESIDKDTGKIQLLGIDLSNENNAITYLNIGNIPALVIVRLTEDSTGKLPLYERISDVVMSLTFSDVKSLTKLMNWCTVIHNYFQTSELEKVDLSEVV